MIQTSPWVIAWTFCVAVIACEMVRGSDEGEFPWQSNTLGITDEVPAPWTPVKAEGDRVRVWGRTIDFGDALLPTQISSQEIELLAAPASIAVTTPDQGCDLDKPRIRRLETRDDRLVREAVAQGDTLSVRTVTIVEFDGMIRVKLILTPLSPTTVERITVTVPLVRDVAQIYGRYLSYDFQALRTDKMSLATCMQPINDRIHSDFNPEIWIGNRDVGITWAAETNCQYDLIDPAKTLSVVPTTDHVEFVVSIVDHRVTLHEPKVIEFALFPTPLKPIDPRMRQIRLAAFGRHRTAFAASVSPDTYDYYSICMPRDFDARYDSLPVSSHSERYLRLRSQLATASVKYIPYGALFYTNAVRDDPRRFYDQWHNTPVSKSTLARWSEYDQGETRDLNLMQGLHWDGYRVCPTPRSYADFLVWTYANAIKSDDLDGIYFDHGEISHSCRNPNHNHFQNATGQQHKYHYGTFAARELLKRLWIATKTINPDLVIIQHQSRSLKSLNSFLDIAVTGEAMNVLFAGSPSSSGVRENPASYKPDYDRIPDILMKFDYLDTFGFESRILPQVKYCIEPFWNEHPKEYDTYSRKMFRHTLLNGVRHWAGNMSQTAIIEAWTALDRIGRLDETVAFHPYWNNEESIETAHPKTFVSYYGKPGQVLAFVGNCGDKDVEELLFLKHETIFNGAIDAVTGEPIPMNGNRIRLTVPAGLYRAVFITR